MSWCEDDDRKEEIEEEIYNFKNEQLSDAYFYLKYLLGKTIDVIYTKRNQISNNIFSKYVSIYDSDYYDSEYDSDSDSILN